MAHPRQITSRHLVPFVCQFESMQREMMLDADGVIDLGVDELDKDARAFNAERAGVPMLGVGSVPDLVARFCGI